MYLEEHEGATTKAVLHKSPHSPLRLVAVNSNPEVIRSLAQNLKAQELERTTLFTGKLNDVYSCLSGQPVAGAFLDFCGNLTVAKKGMRTPLEDLTQCLQTLQFTDGAALAITVCQRSSKPLVSTDAAQTVIEQVVRGRYPSAANMHTLTYHPAMLFLLFRI